MQAATHLAGAALTLAVARGFGLPVGPFEAGALLLGSLLPDIDTTTAGAGRYVRPLAAWIETRFGHRTVTHGLLFAVAVSALLLPLGVPVALALLYGVLSHLLLDTMNVNGVPLLWPYRLQFWFLPNRSSRIRYGSPQETTLAVALALSGALLWPVGADGFGAACGGDPGNGGHGLHPLARRGPRRLRRAGRLQLPDSGEDCGPFPRH